MYSNNFIELSVSAINCNSMNVSTLGKRNAKTYLKIEGITGKKPDVILISDIRAKDKGDELVKLMGLTWNGSYKLYLNSSKESRGVGIAIKRNIQHEIKNRYIGRGDENVLLLDLNIKGKRITLGVVYGPNGNNQEFFRNIEQKLAQWGNKCIIGGDFNTILSSQGGDQNLDREGIGRAPNVQNSRIINEWLTNGLLVDPYRALYPENRMVSYIPFTMRNIRADDVTRYGCTRLDFF
jgi:exonuclease III